MEKGEVKNIRDLLNEFFYYSTVDKMVLFQGFKDKEYEPSNHVTITRESSGIFEFNVEFCCGLSIIKKTFYIEHRKKEIRSDIIKHLSFNNSKGIFKLNHIERIYERNNNKD